MDYTETDTTNGMFKRIDDEVKQAYVDFIDDEAVTMETISDYVTYNYSFFTMQSIERNTYYYKGEKVISFKLINCKMDDNETYDFSKALFGRRPPSKYSTTSEDNYVEYHEMVNKQKTKLIPRTIYPEEPNKFEHAYVVTIYEKEVQDVDI